MAEEMRELIELRSQSPETRFSKHDNRGMRNKVNSREFVLLHNRVMRSCSFCGSNTVMICRLSYSYQLLSKFNYPKRTSD